MFHLRSTTSIFKLVLGISIVVVVFIIIQMSYLPRADQKDMGYGGSELERRLIHLESDLSQSRRVAGELHQAVQRLMTQEAAPPPPHPAAAAPAARRPPPVAADGGRCEFGARPPSATDVQMLKVYDELPFDNPDGGAWKQGWKITYDSRQWSADRKLRVFVVPHSHNDPGWLKTFERYYAAQTRNIFNAMVPALERHPRMKFIWAEISYLDLWWSEITDDVKERVRRLVSNGQLELVTAGWVMPDEANSHYWAVLDQLVTGHEWLRLHLNTTVRNGWAIDPFGLSSTTAYLLRRAGLDHMVIQRAHYVIKRRLARQKQLEFRWRQTWDSGDSTDMFCHLMPFYSYDAPHSCGPDPKVCCQFDFARLPGGKYNCPWRIAPKQITDDNVKERAATLLDQYRKRAQLYNSNVLMVPLGDDFRYDREQEWDAQYLNYQRLFDFMNSQTEWHVEAQFGTLSDYFSALETDARRAAPTGLAAFPSLSGDFFTYADKNDEYWSGYYTSRPFHKRMDRDLIGHLRAAEILYSLALAALGSSPSTELRAHTSLLMADLVRARQALGLFQHHDGITGTARDNVVIDYANKMFSALRRCQRVMQQSAELLLQPQPALWRPDFSATYWEAAERRQTAERPPRPELLQLEDGPRAVLLYNALAHRRVETVTVQVSSAHVQVTDPDGTEMVSQCAPVFDGVSALVEDRHWLTFVADLPPLSLTAYSVRQTAPDENRLHSLATVSLVHVTGSRRVSPQQAAPYTVEYAQPAPFSIDSPALHAELGPDGLLTSLTSDGGKMALSVDFATYGVRRGPDMSGAYLFIPDGPARPYQRAAWPYRVVRGKLCSEVAVQLPDVLHTVWLSQAEGAADADWLEIRNEADVSRRKNFELAMRLTSAVSSGDRFVTDLNGYQTIERRTFGKLPIQGNYYPVPGLMYIEDERSRLTLTLGQPLGGASLRPGQMEVMLDRRLMQDDNRGLGQGVTDTRRAASTFRLMLEHPDQQAAPAKPLASLLAHGALRAQLNPIQRLLEPREPTAAAPAGRRRWTAAAGRAACDVELVALRTLVGAADGGDVFRPGGGALLTVRRLAADCRFRPPVGASCGAGTDAPGKLRMADLLSKGFRSEADQVSLTGVHRGRSVAMTSPLALDPMEMYAFLLKRG